MILDIRYNGGFTIIELMITVAILGVLAAIAVPAYSNYVNKTAVSEAIQMARPAQISVADYFLSTSTIPSSNSQVGLNSAGSYIGRYVTGVQVNANGVISSWLVFPNGESGVINLTPTFSESQTITWSCTTPSSGSGAIPSSSLPSTCSVKGPTLGPLITDPDLVNWNEPDCLSSGGSWHPGWAWKCDCATAHSQPVIGWRDGGGCSSS